MEPYEQKEGSLQTSPPSPPSDSKLLPNDPYQALRIRDFRLLIAGTFISTMGEQMVNVALGWELYERTHSPLVLGIVGLMQVLPIICFSLPAGHIVDQFDRKRIVLLTLIILTLGSLGITLLSLVQGPIWLFYICLLVIGCAEAFRGPASSTLIPQVVPEEAFVNAATWQSSSWQLSSVIGPALGGLVIGILHRGTLVFALDTVALLIFALLIWQVRLRYTRVTKPEKMTLSSLSEGFNFLRSTHVILAAITLDLFAVLLGGATTLLPIFSQDILHVGPEGLGWLRAAPSVGALCVAFIIAHRPPFKKAGRTLLLAVAGFGAATVIFGLSRSFWLSLLMLFLLGGLDNISVVIRSTLMLTFTPDDMRGRASSVDNLFIAMSNQLGGFESGVAAQLLGPTLAVVGGGVGTIIVVIAVALIWPQMRRLTTLNRPVEIV